MLRDKFALTEQGARDFKRGVGAAALANVVLMAPICSRLRARSCPT